MNPTPRTDARAAKPTEFSENHRVVPVMFAKGLESELHDAHVRIASLEQQLTAAEEEISSQYKTYIPDNS